MHTSLSRKRNVARPTMMVFDLDPGAPADIVQCCQVGLWLRGLLTRMKLKSFAKTSGSKGLQVYVPLNTAVTFDQTKDLSRSLAQHLETDHADLVTSNMSKAARKGKVFVDWSQNDEHKTTICVYSLRAKEEPTVSTPVTWDEVETCLKKEKADLLRFPSDKTLARVEKLGDLFAAVEKLKQKLPKGHPFDLALVRIPKDKSYCPYHAHSAESELYLVVSGRGSVRDKDGTTIVTGGDAFLFQPGEAHQLINAGDDDFVYYVIADNPRSGGTGDSCFYPDSRKWAVVKEGLEEASVKGTETDYFDGEE